MYQWEDGDLKTDESMESFRYVDDDEIKFRKKKRIERDLDVDLTKYGINSKSFKKRLKVKNKRPKFEME